MRREEVVHVMTPTAPLAAHFKENAAMRALGFSGCVADVLRRIAFGIVFRYGSVRGLRAYETRECCYYDGNDNSYLQESV